MVAAAGHTLPAGQSPPHMDDVCSNGSAEPRMPAAHAYGNSEFTGILFGRVYSFCPRSWGVAFQSQGWMKVFLGQVVPSICGGLPSA